MNLFRLSLLFTLALPVMPVAAADGGDREPAGGATMSSIPKAASPPGQAPSSQPPRAADADVGRGSSGASATRPDDKPAPAR